MTDYRELLTKKFDKMMKVLFKQKGANMDIEILSTDEVQDFISEHTAVLDESMATAPMSDVMRDRLSHSNYIFSGMKTFHELNEAFPLLTDENGDRKSFGRFLKDVRSIDDTYNGNYLRAEYNFVNASASMAGRWEQFEEDGDKYYLQYRTQNDDEVRPEHARLDGVTLPIGNRFWDIYLPPNGWNCRCTVVQVRKETHQPSNADEAMNRGADALKGDKHGFFRFNSGKQQKSVPDYNPYTIKRCNDCDVAKGKLGLAYVPENELCAACQYIRNCERNRERTYKHGKGEVHVSRLVNSGDSDYKKLIQVAEFFAKDGAIVKLTPKMSRPPKFEYECVYKTLVGTKFEGKCPDLNVGGAWYEHEGFTSSKPKNAFRNMLNDGLKQSDRLVIDAPDLSIAYMKRVIRKRVLDGQDIKEIWIRFESDIQLLYKKLEE